MSLDRIFVYGTLRPGASAFHIVSAAVTKHVPAVLVDHALVGEGHRHPWCVDSPGAEVAGDLLWLRHPGRTLARLDRYEGIDEMDAEYRRVIAQVLTPEGPFDAWVYVGGPGMPSGEEEVDGGDWISGR